MSTASTMDEIVMLMDDSCRLFKSKSKRKMKRETFTLAEVGTVDASVRYVDEDAGTRFI